MIERKLFIVDLFNSKTLLDSFQHLEFEDFKTFIDTVNRDMITLTKDKRVTIPINTIEEFNIFVTIATKRYFCEKLSINLFIKPELLKDVFDRTVVLDNKRFHITTTIDVSNRSEYINQKGYKMWSQNNPTWIKVEFNYHNFEDVHSEIVETYMKKGYRHFDISFDYESFNELKIEDLHKLEFWINQINIWILNSNDKKEKRQPLQISLIKGKTIFVSKDLKLYITKQAFEEGNMLFDLNKHIDHNGEEVDFKELNKLRSYSDLPLIKGNHIDYYQNWKIMGHVNEIPYITLFIGERLNV